MINGGVQARVPPCKIPETRRLLQEVENIKRRGRREAASLRDEEERYNKRYDTGVKEKENRERVIAVGGAPNPARAPKPQNPTGSTAEDVSTLSSWSRPPTSSMGADAGEGGTKQKRKKRNREGIFALSSVITLHK